MSPRLALSSTSLCACVALLTAFDGCPQGSRAHRGAWVSDAPADVTLYDFAADGGLHVAMESYTSVGAFDGMKLELMGTCEPDAQAKDPRELGGVALTCAMRAVRATQGTALLLESMQMLENYLGEVREVPPGQEGITMASWHLRVVMDGDEMVVHRIDSDGKLRTERCTRVERGRVAPFLERFRKDTAVLRNLPSARRERNLP